MPRETIGRTLGVAAGVCVVCSVFVSAAAVGLKRIQVGNQILERRTNVLLAAGLLKRGERADVDALFKQIDTRVVDLSTHQIVDDVDPKTVDPAKDVENPERRIDVEDPKLGLKHLGRYQLIYLTEEDGKIKRIVLPVVGKGLWSTMYGFLALDGDMNTIESLSFYQQGETPGLGGEVDNPKWKKLWVGKEAYGENGKPDIRVIKGHADPGSPNEIDGLSGATLTSRGVENLVRFWLSDEGYGPILKKLREQA
jgi:Na+-transporting NADH:ubiquinone oxidoreductase subunit C